MESTFFENEILLLGILLVFGYLGSLVLKKFRIPHIVTFLLTGFLLANTILKDQNAAVVLEDWFIIAENLALGLIGFKIGTELKFSMLRKNPKFIVVVLFAEVTVTFAVITTIVFLIWQDFLLAIIMGGLGTATAPMATVEILRKLKAKGPLTQRVQWILAFDDFIAVTIVEAILVYVSVSLGGSHGFSAFFEGLFQELILAIIVGFVIGNILDLIIERIVDDIERMEVTLAIIVVSIGLALFIHTSVIVVAMMIGVVVTNKKGDNFEKAQDLLEYIMSPIIMIFFVLVGAQITISDLSPFPWLVVVYVITRTFGKLSGSYLGTKAACKTPVIQKNLGLGLLAQGGVSLGLAAIAGDVLARAGYAELGHTIISAIVLSTLATVTLGSIGTTFAVRRAGEENKLIDYERPLHYHEGEEELRAVSLGKDLDVPPEENREE